MARLIDVQDVVPDDIIVKAGEQEWVIPGDMTTPEVFRLLDLFVRASDIDGGDLKAVQRNALEFDAFLLTLLKHRHPELEALPFGRLVSQAVAAAILESFGFAVAGLPDEPTADDGRDPTKRPAGRKKSGSSTGSARSKRSSAGSPGSGD